MNKRFFVVLSVLVIASMALAACGGGGFEHISNALTIELLVVEDVNGGGAKGFHEVGSNLALNIISGYNAGIGAGAGGVVGISNARKIFVSLGQARVGVGGGDHGQRAGIVQDRNGQFGGARVECTEVCNDRGIGGSLVGILSFNRGIPFAESGRGIIPSFVFDGVFATAGFVFNLFEAQLHRVYDGLGLGQ